MKDSQFFKNLAYAVKNKSEPVKQEMFYSDLLEIEKILVKNNVTDYSFVGANERELEELSSLFKHKVSKAELCWSCDIHLNCYGFELDIYLHNLLSIEIDNRKTFRVSYPKKKLFCGINPILSTDFSKLPLNPTILSMLERLLRQMAQ